MSLERLKKIRKDSQFLLDSNGVNVLTATISPWHEARLKAIAIELFHVYCAADHDSRRTLAKDLAKQVGLYALHEYDWTDKGAQDLEQEFLSALRGEYVIRK